VETSGYFGIRIYWGECDAVSQLKYVEYSKPDSVFVPNIFTPNGDDHNETFRVITSGTDVKLAVYNKFGSLVFGGDGRIGWDGGNAPSGIYYWLASYLDCSESRKTLKGWIHLIR
jgi:gliding motility-associated-like protein